MVEEKKVRKGYKKTEVGIIPEDWEVVTLGEISEITMGQSPDSKFYNTKDIGMPLIQGNADIKNRKTIIRQYTSKITKKAILNDIIMTVRAPVGYIGRATSYCCIGRGVASIRYKNEYLYHYLIYIENDWNKFSKGTTFDSITSSEVKGLQLPIPLLEVEQKAIAKALTDTDNLIQSIEKLIDKKEKIKQGTMQELLTGKKRLDGFSGEWEVKNLYELVEFINGKAHENFISDIGKYIVVNSRFVSTEGNVIKYSNQGNCLALTNDILMVMSDVPNGRAIAKCYYVEEDNRYTINQRVCILRSKDVISKFLFYVVDRNSYYLSFDDGVKQTNLKRDDVLNLNIKVPPLNEQKAISQAISDMDQEIEALQQKLDKYKTIKKAMMQELLTGRIRLI